eukprot:g331.t1
MRKKFSAEDYDEPLSDIEKRAMGMKLKQIVRKNDIDGVAVLLAAGVDVNECVRSDFTPLMTAVTNSSRKCVSFLANLEKTNLNAKDLTNIGNTALHIACCNGEWGCVKALVGAGAKVEETNSLLETPLQYATKEKKGGGPYQEKDIVQKMLEYQWEGESDSDADELPPPPTPPEKKDEGEEENVNVEMQPPSPSVEENVVTTSEAKDARDEMIKKNQKDSVFDTRHKSLRDRDKAREEAETARRDAVFDSIDTDNSGKISRKEFLKAKMGTESDFDDFDEDGSGWISRFEFRRKFKVKWYNNSALIFDCGSEVTKAGMAGALEPWVVQPTNIGINQRMCPHDFEGFMPQRKMTNCLGEDGKKRFSVGWDARYKHEYYNVRRLVDLGSVRGLRYEDEETGVATYETKYGTSDRAWSEISAYMRIISDQFLTTTPEDRGLVYIVHPSELPGYYEKLASTFFDELNCPGLYLGCHQQLSLYSTGRTTGCVLDIGGGVTFAAPFHDGELLKRGLRRLPFGGGRITDWFHCIMRKRLRESASFARSEGLPIVRTRVPGILGRDLADHVKKKLGYIALGETHIDIYKRQCAMLEKKGEGSLPGYELPDGNIFQIGTERIQGPESLFHPELLNNMVMPVPKSATSPGGPAAIMTLEPLSWREKGRWGARCGKTRDSLPGVHEIVAEAIEENGINSDTPQGLEVKADLYRNIVLSGGTSKTKGFAQRFEQEFSELATAKVEITEACEYATWVGASLLASLQTFSGLCLTKQHFEEIGPHLVGKHMNF